MIEIIAKVVNAFTAVSLPLKVVQKRPPAMASIGDVVNVTIAEPVVNHQSSI